MGIPNMKPGQSVKGTVIETDAKGNDFAPPPADITVETSDGSIMTITNNGDGTVTATAVAPGNATETIGDNQFPAVTDPEQGVVVDVPVSIRVNWGTPQ